MCAWFFCKTVSVLELLVVIDVEVVSVLVKIVYRVVVKNILTI